MDRDDFVRMAREADAVMVFDAEVGLFGNEKVERFAKLVAAAEREACAQIAFNAKTYLEAAAAIRARGQQ